MDELVEYVRSHMGQEEHMEGSADAEELAYMTQLIKREGVKTVGEVGFNAGIASYTLLKDNSDIVVTSFDIGEHTYVRYGKEFIDERFPGRHTLVLGDSRETVPTFAQQNPGFFFDLIFIDGGHDYEVAKADLRNMRGLAHDKTLLILDDITPWLPWGKGPTKAWTEALREGLVVQEELLKDGNVVNTVEPPGERSWVLGHYKL